MQATPDTGAEATVAGLNFLRQMKLDSGNIWSPPDDTIIAANGTSIDCIGAVDIYIHVAGKSTKETVLICKEQRGLLLAWYVCRDLGIVPHNYPTPVCSITRKNMAEPTSLPLVHNPSHGATSAAKPPPVNPPHGATRAAKPSPTGQAVSEKRKRSRIRKQLLEEFRDVFDNSGKLKTMAGEPMKIHLAENAEPFAITTTRTIPVAWRDEVKASLDSMSRQGIVKPLGDHILRDAAILS